MSSSTTPQAGSSSKRSASGTRRPPSRPTTPLRASSRSSLRELGKASVGGASDFPLESFEPQFAELSDSMADLEANFMHLQLMHESLARFSRGKYLLALLETYGSALANALQKAPITDSFRRAQQQDEQLNKSLNLEKSQGEFDSETTFMTTDTSFVENPPSSKATSKFSTPAPSSRKATATRGGMGPSSRGGAARGEVRGTRASGLARAAKGRSLR
ncbi:hypothetical protein B7463_g12126, partial [Scytalidium lignicola]